MWYINIMNSYYLLTNLFILLLHLHIQLELVLVCNLIFKSILGDPSCYGEVQNLLDLHLLFF